MKRLTSILLAIAMLLAAPALLTSCQEDAPEINYTMEVSVINDFTKIVEAINNGNLNNDEAISLLVEAIDKMNSGQSAKLQAIADVLTSMNTTLETKLTVLEAAIKALPDYGQILEDLKAAIESGGGSTPVFTNTVTLDGVTMPILSAAIDKSDLEGRNCYDIYLFLSEDKNKYIEIMANGEHHNGKTLDLTRKEDEHDGWYWAVEMRNPQKLFQTFGEPGSEYPVFLSGTLQVKRIGTGTEFEITLKNGKVKGEGEYGDDLEHTVSMDFKGELEFDEF